LEFKLINVWEVKETYFFSPNSKKKDPIYIAARGIAMARYGKIRIKEGKNRGYVYRS
jgi:hypothetical protein